jgi:hypothetical protein
MGEEDSDSINASLYEAYGLGNVTALQYSIAFEGTSIRVPFLINWMAQSTNVTAATAETKDLTTISKGLQQCETNLTFEDVAPKTTQEEPTTNPNTSVNGEQMQLIDPFPDQTPHQILSKEYEIATIDMSGSFTELILNFPDALFQIDAIARVVEMYRYFKAGVQIDFRLTPSVYHQGALMIGTMPGIHLATPLSAQEDIYRLSAFQPVTLSFSTQQQATLTMNWSAPFPYYDQFYNTDNTTKSMIGSVLCLLATPFRDLSAAGDFTITVFAKFLNPHLAGPLPVASTKKKRIQHQSSTGVAPKTSQPIDIEDMVKTTSGVMTSSASAGPISPILDLVGMGMNVVKSIGGATGLFDKPTSSSAGHVMIHKSLRDFTQTTGLDFSQRLSQYPTSRLANNKMFGKQFTSHSSISSIAQIPMLHHVAELHEGTVPSTSFVLVCHPAEVDSSSYAAHQFDYLSYISRACKRWRGSIKYHFKFIAPSFSKTRVRITLQYDTSTVLGTKGDLFTRIVEISGDTDCSITVPFFYNRYWDYTTVALDRNLLVVELVDKITGNAGVSTPIVDVMVFRAGGEDIAFADLGFAYIAPYIPPPAIKAPIKKQEKIEHQSSIRTVFSKPFDTIACDCSYSVDKNFCTSEQLTSVQEIIKRYSTFHNQNPGANPLNDIWLWPTNTGTIETAAWWIDGILQPLNQPVDIVGNPFQYFLSLFLYVRGDVRVRLVDTAATAGGIAYAAMLDPQLGISSANSMVLTDFHSSPELSFEVPYSSNVPWHPIQGPIASVDYYDAEAAPRFGVDNPANTGFTASYEKFVSASDNFLAGILMPPPRVWGGTTTTTRKLKSRNLRTKVTNSKKL